VLTAVLGGDGIELTLTSEDTPSGGNGGGGVPGFPPSLPPRRYTSLAAMAADCQSSRMTAGLHFPFSGDDGAALGAAVAARVVATYPGKLARTAAAVLLASSAASPGSTAPPPPPPDALYDMVYDHHMFGMPGMEGMGAGADVIPTLTNGTGAFLETPFDETFAGGGGVGPQWADAAALNATRWLTLAPQLRGCGSGGGGGEGAGDAPGAPCTHVDASRFVTLNATLPGYPGAGGARGARIALSQAPCAAGNATACGGAACASGELRSRGCWQFGTFEVEAALDFPPGAAARFSASSWVAGGAAAPGVPFLDTAWNEVDATVYLDAGGIGDYVLNTTVRAGQLLAGQLPPARRPSDAVAFNAARDAARAAAATGLTAEPGAADAPFCDALHGSCSLYAPFIGAALPAAYGTEVARSYHTYKVVWDPQWLLFMVDMRIYRNVTPPPWRPMQMRVSLLAGAAAGCNADDAHAYIRRVRHYPVHNLSKIGDAVEGPWPPEDLDGWGIRVAPPAPAANTPPQPPAPPPFPPYPPWPPSPSPPPPPPPGPPRPPGAPAAPPPLAQPLWPSPPPAAAAAAGSGGAIRACALLACCCAALALM
jgi:hypothetical protein